MMAALLSRRTTFVISIYLLVLVNLSLAWTNTAARGQHPLSSRVHNALKKSTAVRPSLALNYNNGDGLAKSSDPNDTMNDELDTAIRLKIALDVARDADRIHGLCTPESARAWQVVDDIYSRSDASRRVEDSVKRVLGGEKSIWSSFEERSYAA